MRTKITAPSLIVLSRATALIALGGFLTACSSDAIRFEDALTTNSTLTPNQRAIIEKTGGPIQAYPGDERKPIRHSDFSSPAPTVERGRPLAAAVDRSPLNAPTVSGPIASSNEKGQVVLQPRQAQTKTLRVLNADTVTTGSVPLGAATPPAAPKAAPAPTTPKAKPRQTVRSPIREPRPVGWNKSAGTTVTVRSGETLYNLSRRYGVPVKAIMKANSMTSDSLAAGAKIVIPTYSYGENAPVSAPDNNPRTKKAKASRDVVVLENGSKQSQQVAQKQERERPADTLATGSVPAKEIKAPTVKASKAATKTVNIAKRAEEKVSTPKKSGSASFRWPVKGRIIAKFGERKNGGANDGIDISVPLGTPIKASENGTVIYAGSELQDFGKLILLSHAGGWVSAYAHASNTMVKRGDKVRRGQVIAKSGKSGNATVPKLHFELRKNSNPVNPLKHLAK